MVTLLPSDPLSSDLRATVADAIGGFIASQAPMLEPMGRHVEPLVRLAGEFTAGGKRLRPAFCLWGAVAAGASVDVDADAPLVRLAASLDLLHVSALMHDDVMDDSDTRRGQPAAHIQYADLHRKLGYLGDADGFGLSGAVLLGDLLLMWSTQMADTCGLAPDVLDVTRPLLQAMRAEVACGQFLDVTAQVLPFGEPGQMVSDTELVVEYKSARYSVQRPVMIGAAAGAVLSGRDAASTTALMDSLDRFGSLVGRAFQYRDDVLGVFGDSDVTGKPAGDDLREGKRTVLIAETLSRVDANARERLQGLLGRDLTDAEVDDARRIITDAGALDRVEEHITTATTDARATLDRAHSDGHVTDAGHDALLALMHAAVDRDH